MTKWEYRVYPIPKVNTDATLVEKDLNSFGQLGWEVVGIGGGGGMSAHIDGRDVHTQRWKEVYVILKREIDPVIKDARIKAALEPKEVGQRRLEDDLEDILFGPD